MNRWTISNGKSTIKDKVFAMEAGVTILTANWTVTFMVNGNHNRVTSANGGVFNGSMQIGVNGGNGSAKITLISY